MAVMKGPLGLDGIRWLDGKSPQGWAGPGRRVLTVGSLFPCPICGMPFFILGCLVLCKYLVRDYLVSLSYLPMAKHSE